MTRMSENPSTDGYTDEGIELSDQDQADLARLFNEPDGVEAPTFHTVLEVWREVLRPAAELAGEKVTPQYASKMIQSYPGLGFPDIVDLQARYYAKIGELAAILDVEIASDPDCLSYADPAEDALENAAHYKNLLMLWQQTFLGWELDWDTTAADAAIELAAIGEVHKMFFGQIGLTAYLDNIRFEYTEADSEMLAQVLQEQREAAGARGE